MTTDHLKEAKQEAREALRPVLDLMMRGFALHEASWVSAPAGAMGYGAYSKTMEVAMAEACGESLKQPPPDLNGDMLSNQVHEIPCGYSLYLMAHWSNDMISMANKEFGVPEYKIVNGVLEPMPASATHKGENAVD